jgi:transcriptional/translational regulatory protein YebC/TACO1
MRNLGFLCFNVGEISKVGLGQYPAQFKRSIGAPQRVSARDYMNEAQLHMAAMLELIVKRKIEDVADDEGRVDVETAVQSTKEVCQQFEPAAEKYLHGTHLTQPLKRRKVSPPRTLVEAVAH